MIFAKPTRMRNARRASARGQTLLRTRLRFAEALCVVQQLRGPQFQRVRDQTERIDGEVAPGPLY